MYSRLIKDSYIYVLGELLSKAMPFLLLPYLTRRLGVSGFGELSYYQSLISFIIIFISLSQYGAVTRYYYIYGKRAVNLIITAGYGYSFIILVIGLLLSFILKSELLVYCFLIAFFQSIHSVQLYIRQCSKKSLSFVKLQIFTSLLNTVLTIILLEIFQDKIVEKRLLAMLIAYMTVSIAAYYQSAKIIDLKYRFSIRQYKIALLYVLSFGSPLVFHALSYTIKGQFDRVLIFNSFNTTDLGIYAAGVQIASIISVIAMAVNTAVIPYIYQAFKDKVINKLDIIRWYYLSLIAVPLPFIISILIPKHLIIFLLGQDFYGSLYYFYFFVFNYSLMIPYLVLVSYLFYRGKTKQIALSSVASVVIYIIALFILSKYDLKFIPLATLISNIAVLPFLMMFIYRSREIS